MTSTAEVILRPADPRDPDDLRKDREDLRQDKLRNPDRSISFAEEAAYELEAQAEHDEYMDKLYRKVKPAKPEPELVDEDRPRENP